MNELRSWIRAYLAAILVGSALFTVAFPFLLGSLALMAPTEFFYLFLGTLAAATIIALAPTAILYNLAMLGGWTSKWVFVVAGATVPIFGAAFITSISGGADAAIGGAFYGLVLSPCGAVAGMVFWSVLGPVSVETNRNA